jgi:hypothetical protein
MCLVNVKYGYDTIALYSSLCIGWKVGTLPDVCMYVANRGDHGKMYHLGSQVLTCGAVDTYYVLAVSPLYGRTVCQLSAHFIAMAFGDWTSLHGFFNIQVPTNSVHPAS